MLNLAVSEACEEIVTTWHHPVAVFERVSLADRLALAPADPVLAGHPVVAVVGKWVDWLDALEVKNAELRRQLNRHSDHRSQPGHAGRFLCVQRRTLFCWCRSQTTLQGDAMPMLHSLSTHYPF